MGHRNHLGPLRWKTPQKETYTPTYYPEPPEGWSEEDFISYVTFLRNIPDKDISREAWCELMGWSEIQFYNWVFTGREP